MCQHWCSALKSIIVLCEPAVYLPTQCAMTGAQHLSECRDPRVPTPSLSCLHSFEAHCHTHPLTHTLAQITEEETAQAQNALREGCSAMDMHRLLLGVSFTNW